MASCTEATLSITKNVANAHIEGSATIQFTPFDKKTDIGYDVFFELIGDDTGYDADVEGPDDVLELPPRKRFFVRANGQNNITLDWTPADIAWDELDEDNWFADEEEIRLLVTVEPYNPVTSTRESNVVVLDEINP